MPDIDLQTVMIDVTLADLPLPILHCLPKAVVKNAQFGHFPDDPLVLGIEPRHALGGLRVLDVAQPVPQQLADVELVVQQAGAALVNER